jgi:hypothetical protein
MMDVNGFNATVVRNESPGGIELDVRPFGAGQAEAVDCYLEAALTQGDPFDERKVIIKTDASVVLSTNARALISQLQDRGVGVSVVGER